MQRWETLGEVLCRGGNIFEWKVDVRYFLPRDVDFYIASPSFRYAGSLWYLTKWPCGRTGPKRYRWIGLSLCGTSSQCPVLNVRLGINAIFGEDLKSSTGKTSPSGCFDEPRYLKSWQIQKRRLDISNFGYITVFCEVLMEDGNGQVAEAVPFSLQTEETDGRQIVNEAGQYQKEADDLPLSEGDKDTGKVDSDAEARILKSKSFEKLLQDLKVLWLSEEDCDISFKVQEKEFSAHKIVLKSRCPVFHSMFKHEMVEQTSGVVEIDDCDPDSFRDFLQYVYTGSVENISEENAFNLFAAADKYCSEELRNECLEFIKASLCVDTFCDIMTLSLRYSEEELLEKATKFFAEHFKEIIVMERWLDFLVENTAEGNKLFIKALAAEINAIPSSDNSQTVRFKSAKISTVENKE